MNQCLTEIEEWQEEVRSFWESAEGQKILSAARFVSSDDSVPFDDIQKLRSQIPPPRMV